MQGIIFDFDGTLFDSMYLWETIGTDYLKSVGREPKPGVQDIVKDMSLHQAVCYCQKEYELSLSASEIMDGFNRIIEKFYFDSVQPKDGVIALLEEMRERKMKICIATATDKYLIKAALKRCGMEHYFVDILTCTEIGHGKDEPVIYREAMNRLGTNKENTMIFEDAAYAIRTAKKDGFRVTGIYDSYEKNEIQVQEMADVYLEDYSQKDRFWQFVLQTAAE